MKKNSTYNSLEKYLGISLTKVGKTTKLRRRKLKKTPEDGKTAPFIVWQN
jgi:hypothetical protein